MFGCPKCGSSNFDFNEQYNDFSGKLYQCLECGFKYDNHKSNSQVKARRKRQKKSNHRVSSNLSLSKSNASNSNLSSSSITKLLAYSPKIIVWGFCIPLLIFPPLAIIYALLVIVSYFIESKRCPNCDSILWFGGEVLNSRLVNTYEGYKTINRVVEHKGTIVNNDYSKREEYRGTSSYQEKFPHTYKTFERDIKCPKCGYIHTVLSTH